MTVTHGCITAPMARQHVHSCFPAKTVHSPRSGSSTSCLYLATPSTAHRPKGASLPLPRAQEKHVTRQAHTVHSSRLFTCFFRVGSGARNVRSKSLPNKVAAVLRLPKMLSCAPPNNSKMFEGSTQLWRVPL